MGMYGWIDNIKVKGLITFGLLMRIECTSKLVTCSRICSRIMMNYYLI